MGATPDILQSLSGGGTQLWMWLHDAFFLFISCAGGTALWMLYRDQTEIYQQTNTFS